MHVSCHVKLKGKSVYQMKVHVNVIVNTLIILLNKPLIYNSGFVPTVNLLPFVITQCFLTKIEFKEKVSVLRGLSEKKKPWNTSNCLD